MKNLAMLRPARYCRHGFDVADLVRWLGCLLMQTALLATLLVAPGCSTEERKPPVAQPPPTYVGPDYLRGTIGSLASISPADAEPIIVSKYGLVVLPPGSGTGSREVPSYISEYMVNYVGKQGVGNSRYQALPNVSPRRWLENMDTAVVEVMGLVPAGATPGTRFDVLVNALPQTQTTSLAGGTLWTTDLSIGQPRDAVRLFDSWGKAYGPIYTNPFDEKTPQQEQLDYLRKGVIVAGGQVTRRRRIRLVLNQASWFRSRAIADRINERFPVDATEKIKTANAQTDVMIELAIPE
ncbi:MAG: flagellar basal body P-ring protein FlgI, partial [Rhodospirillales bacterium]|nr:flagellar basal body P-ring protein FlgI [Rhodospirillales bacterium]